MKIETNTDKGHPLVSIVTPSFNQDQFVERTVVSVLGQDYPRVEYIVIDGGSTDNTLDILKKYESKLAWTSNPDNGQSDAINKGFRIADGEILAWLNSDDVYHPKAVSKVVEFLEKNPEVGMVYGDCDIIDENDNQIRQYHAEPFDFTRLLNRGDIIPQQSSFFRRTVLDTVGHLDINLHYAMDLDLFLRIGKQFEIRYINEHLASFRVYGRQKTQGGGLWNYRKACKEQNTVRRKYGANLLIRNRMSQNYILLRKFLLNNVFPENSLRRIILKRMLG